MNTVETSGHSPIYERLIQERGDVVSESRKAAELTQRVARDALDWSGLQRSQSAREERAFSPFG
ncbi:hypothetical protein GT204_26880 [Streptomyces sp. SID4919]|uniref:Uncharacterized protein n=1 Tax=Streptomyces uncialis TaxID=1048205 RepID=A0A1Q4VA79_9ACTN|nr:MULTISPECIES: hypothetical protein [Streptomyces]MCX4658468.1 hypothetical protein [Streptomyces uncialis]MYY12433.1 hypothetical protein [Streptomyces sp. SID4919]OKH94713.1 hypothetical protein AB852_10970 [Streptomyces uncialis]WST66746.1 hypothetical protein OG268_03950 [Streptomyces uncialis]WTE14631.1 hypothetical protein OG924_33020 [Streptomyces uncialis]